jgi:hypothetical protein
MSYCHTTEYKISKILNLCMSYFLPPPFSDNRFRLCLNYEYEATNVRTILDKLEVSMRAL